MQNLSGNSIDKFYKSCSVFHQECNKNEFAFFRFFYDLLCILQDSAKWLYYLRLGFTPGSLELSKASQVCPWFTEKSLERSQALQCCPWGWGRRGWPEFRWGQRRSRPGRSAGRCASSPRRQCTTMPGCGGHGGLGPGERGAWACQRAGARAQMWGRECDGVSAGDERAREPELS
jgi:hypothetical protein